MLYPPKMWFAAACVALGVATPLSADIIAKTSENPVTRLDQNLDGLLGQQRRDLAPERGNLLQRMFVNARRAAPPQPVGTTSPISYTRRFLSARPTASGDAQWACLTEALYFEARGESVRGLFGVAEVILNRVDSGKFPSTVCAVVNQGTGRKYQCQFTFTCDGHPESVHEPRAWVRVGKVARLMLDGAPRPLTHGATHYHTTAVRPNWSRIFPRTATIGVHHFYRPG